MARLIPPKGVEERLKDPLSQLAFLMIPFPGPMGSPLRQLLSQGKIVQPLRAGGRLSKIKELFTPVARRDPKDMFSPGLTGDVVPPGATIGGARQNHLLREFLEDMQFFMGLQ